MSAKVCVLLVLCGLAAVFAVDSHKKHYPPMPYSFSYGVKDPHHGADFSQSEKSDGNQVKGSYTVQLPDGRKQIVEYVADHHNGFVAKVTYHGKAQYPSKVGPPVTFKPQEYHR